MYMDFSPEAQADEKHEVFGDKQHFWTKYDHLANEHDKEMVGRYNDHLDVLLLFAGLFAGIEAGFVSLTLGGLKPSSAFQTNHLLEQLLLQASNRTFNGIDLNPPPFKPASGAMRQNCFFVASLCSSLMAATGAILAKQWLSNYESYSYTGSLENQALHRTEKFLALEAWGLHRVLETLPTLLLISFGCFFIALIDYLWAIHHMTALVVLAFSGAGALAYLFSLIVATIHPSCPFQTPVSRQIQGAASMLSRLTGAGFQGKRVKKTVHAIKVLARAYITLLTGMWASRSWLRDRTNRKQISVPSICQAPKTWRSWVSDLSRDEEKASASRRSGHGHRSALQKEELSAQSIVYLLKYSTSEDDLRSIADNIPALSHPEPVRLIARSPFFPRLLDQLIQARLGLECEGGHKIEEDALAYSVAVAHVLAADPTTVRDMIFEVIQERDSRPRQSKISRDVFALEVGIVGLCLHVKPSSDDHREVGLSVLAAGRAAGVTNLYTSTKAVIQTMDVIDKQSALSLSTLLALSGSALATSNDYIIKLPPTSAFFSLAALSLSQEIELGIGMQQPMEQRLDDVWSARTGKDVKSFIIAALNAHNEFLLAPQRNIAHFLQPYTTLIRRFRNLHSHLCHPPYRPQTSKQHSSPGTSVSWDAVATLTCAAAFQSHTAQDTLVRCLSNLALLFTSISSVQPRTTPHFDPNTERDLKAYALQVLLSLECRSLIGEVWSLNQLQASAVAQSLIALDLRGAVEDTEISDVLRVLGSTLTSLPTQCDTYHVISHPSLNLLVVQALNSISLESSLSALKLLDHTGGILAGDSGSGDVPNLSQSIGDQLGCAVICSWTRSLARGSTALHDMTGLRRLLRWIARSATTDPSLAMSLAESGVARLFQLAVPMLSRELHVKGLGIEAPGTQDAITATLYLGILYVQARAEISDAMSDVECEALTRYVRELMPKLRFTHESSTGDVEILLRQTLSLIELVIQYRPATASAVALGDAYEWLVRRVDDQGGEERLEGGRGRRRDLGKRKESDAGASSEWWKFGGLEKACAASCPPEIL